MTSQMSAVTQPTESHNLRLRGAIKLLLYGVTVDIIP
jgi:hypothetical protein